MTYSHNGIRQMTKEDGKNYKTINFGSHVPNADNAIVVHDTPLVLCLGLVHSFESKQGCIWAQGPREGPGQS